MESACFMPLLVNAVEICVQSSSQNPFSQEVSVLLVFFFLNKLRMELCSKLAVPDDVLNSDKF